MNNKGFTLVELLATVVLIALIMTIILPSAAKISNNNKTRIYQEYEKMMIEYAKLSNLNNQNTIDLYDLEELDKVKNECFGYVKIDHSKTPIEYSSYITCGNQYTSENYDSSLVNISNNICKGCKFIYTTDENNATWNTGNITPTALTSGLKNTYQEVVSSSGKNYFLGVVLNSSNQATRVYACGVKDNIPFCIEGMANDSVYDRNKAKLLSPKLWDKTCDIQAQSSNESIHCGTVVGTIDANAEINGSVFVGVVNSGYCKVFNNGIFKCMNTRS